MSKRIFNSTVISLIDSEVSSFCSYLEEIQKYLENNIDAITEEMVEEEKKIGKEDKINQKSIELTNKYISLTDFPNILLSSFLVFSYSYFEAKLNWICKYYENTFHYEITLEDLNDKGFLRAKKYLEKICKVKMPGQDIKEDILWLGKIRNCIVHNNGTVKEEKLFNYIKNHASEQLRLNKNKIMITYEYAHHILDTCSKYLKFVIQQDGKTINST